eukprot:1139939-Pelagomonas_calceolata.AAC.1
MKHGSKLGGTRYIIHFFLCLPYFSQSGLCGGVVIRSVHQCGPLSSIDVGSVFTACVVAFPLPCPEGIIRIMQKQAAGKDQQADWPSYVAGQFPSWTCKT